MSKISPPVCGCVATAGVGIGVGTFGLLIGVGVGVVAGPRACSLAALSATRPVVSIFSGNAKLSWSSAPSVLPIGI